MVKVSPGCKTIYGFTFHPVPRSRAARFAESCSSGHIPPFPFSSVKFSRLHQWLFQIVVCSVCGKICNAATIPQAFRLRPVLCRFGFFFRRFVGFDFSNSGAFNQFFGRLGVYSAGIPACHRKPAPFSASRTLSEGLQRKINFDSVRLFVSSDFKVFHFFILPIDFFTLLCYNGSGSEVRFSGSLSAPPGAFGECLLLEPGSTHFFYAFSVSNFSIVALNSSSVLHFSASSRTIFKMYSVFVAISSIFPPSFQKRFTPSTLRLNYTIKAPKNQEKSLFLVLNNSTLCAYLFR